MILVPNHRQLLSGNKVLFLLALVLFFSACSKKIIPSGSTTQRPDKPVSKEPVDVIVKKDRDHSLALLLPFELNKINLNTVALKDLEKAGLAIDFYQGFKLALDSLTQKGHNFELRVFDTREQETHLVNLAMAPSVLENDVIVGPIFPESIETFSSFAEFEGKVQVSPLAASLPSQFKNPRLVTLNNSIDQHARKIAEFIQANYKSDQVNILLINTQSSDDEKFAAPLREYIKELSSGLMKVNERPNAIGIQTYLNAARRNLVIMAPVDKAFVEPTINKLYSLSNENYRIEVFGHPNWARADFLDLQKLQGLNTRITSSYHVDFKSSTVKHFVARYRDEYGMEPSEYAFKGFDTAYYFGRLLEKYGRKYTDHLKEPYQGLHNGFRLMQTPESGYINSELMILKYEGFELKIDK